MIAETDVTRLRRDPKALAEVKEAVRMPKHPRRAEKMPTDTVYRGDPPRARLRVKGRVGNPPADQG